MLATTAIHNHSSRERHESRDGARLGFSSLSRERSHARPSRFADNGPLNFTDPTGMYQQGNPLDSLFGNHNARVPVPTSLLSQPSLFGNRAASIPSLKTSVPSSFLQSSSFSLPFLSNSSSATSTAYTSVQSAANYFTSRPGYYESLADAPRFTYQELAYAELNPHGPPVSIQTIVSPVFGDIPRSAAPALTNFINTTSSPLAAGVAQFVKPLVGFLGNAAGGAIDAVLPPSDPSTLTTYRDGAMHYSMGEGPSTEHYANLLLLAAPPVFRGASRPAGSLTLQTAPKTTITPSSRGIWDLTPEARWTAVEQQLGKNLPTNYPVIDKFDNGIATSIKSLDLAAPTYSNPAAISRLGSGYVDKVAGFQGRAYARFDIRASQITERGLDLAVPPGATPAQRQALQDVVTYGRQKGVAVNIVETR